MPTNTLSRTLWSALTPAADAYPSLTGEHSVDVLIIGGGFLGLSTALHLAEGGTRVMLLEAAEPGFGASGRNTGFVVPSLSTGLGPEDVEARLGQGGERLMRLVGESANTVFGLIERLAIDCSPVRSGWLQPAHRLAMLRVLEQRQKDWKRLGRQVEILDASETRKKIGGGSYPGALFDPTGGQINPLAYARGLARAAAKAGADIYMSSKVLKLDRSGPRPTATTASGRVTAERVLLATNALVDGLCPEVATSMIPVRGFQVATQTVHKDARADVMPTQTPVADTRHHTFAVRWSPDNRLITGGLVLPGPWREARAERYFLKRLETIFPSLAPLRAEYVWSGVIAITMDWMPRFMRVAPRIDAAIGCNGRGVAMTTSLGREIAGLYSGQLDESLFPLPIVSPKPVAGHAIARHGPMLWLPWSNLRDRLEMGQR